MNKSLLVLALLSVLSTSAYATGTNNNCNGKDSCSTTPTTSTPSNVTNTLNNTLNNTNTNVNVLSQNQGQSQGILSNISVKPELNNVVNVKPTLNTNVNPTLNTTIKPTLNTDIANNSNSSSTANGGNVSGSGNSDNTNTSSSLSGSVATGGQGGSSNSQSTSGDSSSSSTGGSSKSSSGSSSGGNQIGGDSTSNNTEIRTLFLPSHVVPVPPSLVAGAQVITSVGTCGVLQQVVREPVTGVFSGVLWDSKIDLGVREYLVPNDVPFKEYNFKGKTYLIGHQPTILSTVVSTGGARQFGLGGNSGTGSGGSGSAGTSGAMQQMTEHIQLTECIFEITENLPTPKLSLTPALAPVVVKKIAE